MPKRLLQGRVYAWYPLVVRFHDTCFRQGQQSRKAEADGAKDTVCPEATIDADLDTLRTVIYCTADDLLPDGARRVLWRQLASAVCLHVLLLFSVVHRLLPCRRDVPDLGVQATVVPPVDVLERGEFDLLRLPIPTVNASVLAIPACGSRRTRMVETPARPARTTLRVPRHLVVRPDPHMSHATRTATSGVTVRPRACLALPMDAIRA